MTTMTTNSMMTSKGMTSNEMVPPRTTIRRKRRKGVACLLLLLIVMCQAGPGLSVFCNEFDTCFPKDKQRETTEAVQQDKKERACQVVTSALECLEQAKQDCDATENVPSIIVTALGERKTNLTSYRTDYCVSDSTGKADDVAFNMAAILLTVLMSILVTI
ncbi:hypothetical protein BaRGS_00031864 [Batillaria attramentaria]|uniref:Uncharacterized protein n=1 Tax=Batillaria attramentaria TaxID=370345 RepID=A0ABD0JQH4_9CAEN